MGNKIHYGFTQLNEHENIARAQTVLGTDEEDVVWLDYIKSIDPQKPIYNTEWHFLGGEIDLNNQAMLAQRMFEGVTHGICVGLIWIYRRAEWTNKENGMNQSMTRWPRTLDAIGRASLRMRSLAEPLTLIGNLSGGKIRIIYSLAANTHQGVAYVEKIQDAHKILGQNATGRRFVFSKKLVNDDLKDIRLIVDPGAKYIEADAAKMLETWVAQGGTLWLTAPIAWMDPWGKSLTNLSPDFSKALNQNGKHPFKSGEIFVGLRPELFQFLDGPWAEDSHGFIDQIEIRHLTNETGGWISIMNKKGQDLSFRLLGGKNWNMIASANDFWNRERIFLSSNMMIGAHGVRLIQYSNTMK